MIVSLWIISLVFVPLHVLIVIRTLGGFEGYLHNEWRTVKCCMGVDRGVWGERGGDTDLEWALFVYWREDRSEWDEWVDWHFVHPFHFTHLRKYGISKVDALQITIGNDRSFTYDQVFDTGTIQREVLSIASLWSHVISQHKSAFIKSAKSLLLLPQNIS